MNILIVEDDAVSALILRKTLEQLGHEVVAATNGVEAGRYLTREYVPLVITDWMMPDMDGLDLCRHIRRLEDRPYTYVILLTAKDQRTDRLKGLSAGADDFLVKPLDKDELIARLQVGQRILDMQEQLHKLYGNLEQQNRQLAETMTYLQVANHRFSELFNGIPIPCFTFDRDGRLQEWNQAFEALYGLSPKQVLDRTIQQTIERNEDAEQTQHIIERIFAGESFAGQERTHVCADGTPLDVECSMFPVRTPDGEVVGAISAAVDVTERKRYAQELQEQMQMLTEAHVELEAANTTLRTLATTDGLTGLKNYATLYERLEMEFQRAQRYAEPLSFIFLDVDQFKPYNDLYGHPAGDQVLRRVADLLQQNVRVVDCVARYGGEEFAIVLPKSGMGDTKAVAERMRRAIESANWPLRPITCSFGAASFSPDTETYTQLIREADDALYHSKYNGRNRVTHFAEMPISASLLEAAR